ncbi:hypothetical protein HFE03_25855 [Paenibacillus sp. EKM102P]|uniref:hypothetical protein n=1 Tax=unclassified Paenibacillus TaxID=185978 RepID=UPI00142D6A09|nr:MULTISPECIES: hypothetical protein [unclassified Paenibacillus]KAF6614225.1 hypothetical protein HFE00_25885 [Paenibacillus sp. EKM101P]KAF6616583.1 hypothetical protein HFE03_25855 [Paenibacillus sp. EKM102P]KAF6625043.1 hypothetical protein HFE01_26035 [Paenibacillus sp. EKM10P]KAF6640875.1 hypothetical protein HFE02_25870 [Paenibacillus sp. EKM11P]
MPTIVPANKVKHDPQELLFQFPSIPKVRYTRLSQEYYFWRQVQNAESIAAMFGRLLIPASCMHWQRKNLFESRRVQVGRNYYYVLEKKELTKTEQAKYMAVVKEVELIEAEEVV